MNRNPYFGEPWDVPATEDAPRVDTPVGVPCAWCGVPIEDGDQGFMIGCVRLDQNKQYYGSLEPFHRECQLRMGVGSPAHLEGRCFCSTGEPDHHPQTPTERRAEALEVWDRIGDWTPSRRRRPRAGDKAT